MEVNSGKRKREEEPLPSITYLVGDRSFDRLFKGTPSLTNYKWLGTHRGIYRRISRRNTDCGTAKTAATVKLDGKAKAAAWRQSY